MSFTTTLTRFFSVLTLGFLVCIGVAAAMESYGIGRQWIGYFFIFITFGAYAVIGLLSRTSDMYEYFVASRTVPAAYNGMATAADWMSAASFLGVAGTLFYSGFEALALLVGWTGGFVLIALLIAPYLRKFAFFSVGDFLAARYAGDDKGRVVRLICILVTVSISFVYVIAQIYAVGLITSRFAGVEFGIGVFFGLAGILVCSFLGGMRAVTWTAVAQYIVMILTMLITVVALVGFTGKGASERYAEAGPVSFPEYVRAQERKFFADPAESEVRSLYLREADRYQLLIDTLPSSWAEGYEARRKNLELARYDGSTFQEIKAAERVLTSFPKDSQEAKKRWSQEKQRYLDKVKASVPHFGSTRDDSGLSDWGESLNFLAVAFTLMCGTVALPHLIVRFFTTPNASQTRWSVAVALACILGVYLASPWLSLMAKVVVYENLVGLSYSDVPNWVAAWSRVIPGLATLQDVNQDGVVQFAEIGLSPDILVLITPEIAGMPFFLSGLIAAGGLAAALSTADGLLLAIASSLSHDLYYRILNPDATAQRRVTMSKIALLSAALLAAWITSLQPGNIVVLVGSAFALAASSLFVPLVAGIFWSGATRRGALWAMGTGFVSSSLFLALTNSSFMALFNLDALQAGAFSGVASGILTIPLSAVAMVIASLKGGRKDEAPAVMRVLRLPECE
ncbi:cation/acetate symporter [Limnobacter thiooxidans]|uniref:Cation acetate symporter n=1 Tax=Limnobacter thiooxidans TaxID=131080 RepID=A0AA86J0H6_9BURK|nr:cation/acetate symporter [Limnobacter thiooxidans]BET26793.1 cation acetate symporter [Limnobacter thiooxidans]